MLRVMSTPAARRAAALLTGSGANHTAVSSGLYSLGAAHSHGFDGVDAAVGFYGVPVAGADRLTDQATLKVRLAVAGLLGFGSTRPTYAAISNVGRHLRSIGTSASSLSNVGCYRGSFARVPGFGASASSLSNVGTRSSSAFVPGIGSFASSPGVGAVAGFCSLPPPPTSENLSANELYLMKEILDVHAKSTARILKLEEEKAALQKNVDTLIESLSTLAAEARTQVNHLAFTILLLTVSVVLMALVLLYLTYGHDGEYPAGHMMDGQSAKTAAAGTGEKPAAAGTGEKPDPAGTGEKPDAAAPRI